MFFWISIKGITQNSGAREIKKNYSALFSFKWNNFIVFENHTFALQKELKIKLVTVKHRYKKENIKPPQILIPFLTLNKSHSRYAFLYLPLFE